MTRTIVFKVNAESVSSQTAYEQFINLLAIRGYDFTVSRKHVSSVVSKFFVEVDDISDSDAEYAAFHLGGAVTQRRD